MRTDIDKIKKNSNKIMYIYIYNRISKLELFKY